MQSLVFDFKQMGLTIVLDMKEAPSENQRAPIFWNIPDEGVGFAVVLV